MLFRSSKLYNSLIFLTTTSQDGRCHEFLMKTSSIIVCTKLSSINFGLSNVLRNKVKTLSFKDRDFIVKLMRVDCFYLLVRKLGLVLAS